MSMLQTDSGAIGEPLVGQPFLSDQVSEDGLCDGRPTRVGRTDE